MAKSATNHRSKESELTVAVTQLSEEARVLRMAVDELRDDVVWAARQVLAAGYEVSGQPPPRPVDPLAPDADCRPYRGPNAVESADENLYCCDSPRLAWHGAPDSPGIACTNCGYVVAEEGNILIWRDDPGSPDNPSTDGSTMPIERQGNLFE